ncbi:MAG: adenylyltransferase, partial [Gammaproteobacteria bacterium]|nr:adenylyltransferase [Gammaproteobacteria bacterium]
MIKLIEPHGSELNGGKLVNLYANQTESERLKILSHTLPSWDLTRRQLCDIELLLNGGFSPLDGFLSQEDYENVVVHSRLSNQMLWPIPITLDVSEAFASTVSTGDDIALRDAEGILIAVMQISDKWIPDKNQEAESVFGSADP